MRLIQYNLKAVLLLGAFSLSLLSCQKKDQVFPDPYAGGKKPLGIKLSTDPPSPQSGDLGSSVTFKATGLVRYKDSLVFYLNNERAQVTAVDSNGVTVTVPQTASTGIGSLTVGDQIYFGPVFKVNGKLGIDDNFKALVGANGTVNDVLPLPDGRLILVGSFTDFEHKGAVKPINRIVLTSKDGEVDRSLKSGVAVDGYLNSIAGLSNGKIVIGGGFSSFDSHRGQIHNISVLNNNGSLDSIVVRSFLTQDTVPAFNGGTDGNIRKLFVYGNTITAVGSFSHYLQFVYGKSDYRQLRDSLITDSVRVKNLIRMFPDGSLDSSFNYDFQAHKSYEGPNGPISDGFMQDDGRLIITGQFTKYNGENVNNIVRLNTDGSIDRSFKVGNGADNFINSIRYNATTHRFMLAGGFQHFNGEPHSGLVMLNEDGTIDESFVPAQMGSNDVYIFSQQLSNGMVLVNGFFKIYNGVHRGNFMVLDNKGALAQGYNTTGDLNGVVTQSLETTDATGNTLVMLMGGFDKFDEQSVGNITRLIFK